MNDYAEKEVNLPATPVEVGDDDTAPVRVIKPQVLRQLAGTLGSLFKTYKSERRPLEEQWLKNLRQYRGIYDSEVLQQIPPEHSRAYPRITRVKVLSTQARLMNLMFPGNEKNWELRASPSADIEPQEVMQAIQQMAAADQQAGIEPKPMTSDTVRRAVQKIADDRAREMEIEIEDQLQEIGGDQSRDYIALNRAVVRSGILYGAGLLEGPYAEVADITTWDLGEGDQPVVTTQRSYRPLFEHLDVWDFYPDLSAKRFSRMNGYFTRKVMPRGQLRALKNREGYITSAIASCLQAYPSGNHKPEGYENDLQMMGMQSETQKARVGRGMYEIICFNGQLSGRELADCGAEVSQDHMDDDLDAVVWMIEDKIIRADVNPWRKMGMKVSMLHAFVLDEDDTGLIGEAQPQVMRDSQLAVCAATRMMLDNASVVCGPQLEVNLDLLAPEMDATTVKAFKIWYRDSIGQDASIPAVRAVNIESRINELANIIEMFMRFADQETFVGPGAGGEQQRGFAEPMRTAAGASMLRADAALPFKDIVRNFDTFTQSVITSLVRFNEAFNPRVQRGDINVIARGATSLIAKEVRGAQVDQMAATLSPDERMHVDERKLVEERFAVRDLQNMLVSRDEAERRKASREQQAAQAMEQQQQATQAQIRKVLSDAFKNISQAKRNDANAEATAAKVALDILEKGLTHVPAQQDEGVGAALAPSPAQPGNGGNAAATGFAA